MYTNFVLLSNRLTILLHILLHYKLIKGNLNLI